MITKQTAMNLGIGKELYHISNKNADGTPQRWRVNGKCKTWKTRVNDFSVPVKHGLCSYSYLTDLNNHEMTTDFEVHCCECHVALNFSKSTHMRDFQGQVYCLECRKGRKKL
jgi:hypothetical protein